MTLFPAHRAAEEFDDVLAGRAATEVAERHASLLRTVQTLRSVPAVMPRPEFSADLRERLMAAAVTELVPTAPPVRRPHEVPQRRRNRRVGTIAATLVIVGGSAGMAAAASGALPGEPLYPVKRGIEQATTALRPGDAAQGKALLGDAGNRLDELSALMRDHADQALLSSTVDSFRSEADQGSKKLFEAYQGDGNGDHIVAVRDFTTTQMARLDALTKGSDLGGSTLLVDVADTLADIDQQARVLCNGCGPQATAAPPAALVDGVSATTMRNLITRPVHQAAADVALADRLRQLQQAAQGAAGQASTGTGTGTSLPSSGPGATGDGDDPVTSTITKAGDLVPAVTSKEPVQNLVKGVTGTLKSTGDTVKKVTDGVGDTVDGVTGSNVLP